MQFEGGLHYAISHLGARQVKKPRTADGEHQSSRIGRESPPTSQSFLSSNTHFEPSNTGAVTNTINNARIPISCASARAVLYTPGHGGGY